MDSLASSRLAITCPAPYYRCSDGLCVLSLTECPTRFPTLHLITEYSRHKPYLQFIQSEQVYHHILSHFQFNTTFRLRSCLRKINLIESACPHDAPFRCASGSCVAKASLCPVILPCSPEYAGNGAIRCPDGRCVSDSKVCNTTSPCPPEAPVLCVGGRGDGQCVANDKLCLLDNGCPVGLPYRCLTGFCNVDAEACNEVSLPNGCSQGTPYKCNDGSCKISPMECGLSNGCPLNSPFLSHQGVCLSSPDGSILSTDSESATNCPKESPILCSDGKCVSSPVNCLSSSICNLLRPLQCNSGSCGTWPQQYPFTELLPEATGKTSLEVTNAIEEQVSNSLCQPIPHCPPDAPLLCANMECVTDYAECRPYIGYEVSSEVKY